MNCKSPQIFPNSLPTFSFDICENVGEMPLRYPLYGYADFHMCFRQIYYTRNRIAVNYYFAQNHDLNHDTKN